MDRRQVLAGGLVAASLLPAARAATAQEQAAPAGQEIEQAKVPALVGGNFAKLSSQLAVERAESEAVRTFAELEVAEQEAVAAAFGATGAEIPLREDHAALMEQLQAAEGAAFDTAYVDAQIAGHQELRGIHSDYAENGEDPMARGASMVGVTSIDSHLVILNSIRQQLG